MKQLKKIMVALIAMFGFGAVLAADSAAIGETKYDTLQAAIDAAGAGDTITVLQDVTLEDTLTGNSEIPETAEVVTIGSAADFDDFAAAVNYDNPTPSGSDGYYQGVKASWNKNLYVKITADIDMSKVTFTTAIGSYGNGGGFSGTLDGCGHTLSNYTVSGNWNYARALFRQAEDITVKNITFHNFRSDAPGVAAPKTRPAGVVFASVLGTKNVFENVTVTDSILYGDNGLGILTGYGSGDYYNTYVTEYTFTNCTISNCTIYSGTDRAAILGEFGRDGDVILTISDCTFEKNKLIAKIGGVTTTSDLPVWYNHAAAAIERDGVVYTYEHFGYAEEGKDKLVEVNYALKAAKSGDTIILVKDIEVTEDEAKTAFAKSVDINKDKTNSTAPDGYGWDTEGNLVKIIAKIGETGYWDLDDAINAAHPGQTVVLLDDIDLTAPVVVGEGKSVILDLNGKTITNSTPVWNSDNKDWSLISVRGGDLTITGAGNVHASDCYAVDVCGGNLTIENGSYVGNTTMVYVEKGTATITGGHFDMTQLNDQGNKQHLINASDAEYKAGTATITISGGEFVGFDPENNTAEGEETDFCADGYVSTYDEATGTYSVEAKPPKMLRMTMNKTTEDVEISVITAVHVNHIKLLKAGDAVVKIAYRTASADAEPNYLEGDKVTTLINDDNTLTVTFKMPDPAAAVFYFNVVISLP